MNNIFQNANYILIVAVVFLMVILPIKARSQGLPAEANKKVITEGFSRWAAGTGSFFDLLSGDMEWQITGSTGLSKTYTGKKPFIDEVITPLNHRLAKKIVPTVRYLFAEGDWVVVLWDGQATATDGQPYNMSYAWFMQMKAGKITNVVAFLDGILFNDIMKRIPVNTLN